MAAELSKPATIAAAVLIAALGLFLFVRSLLRRDRERFSFSYGWGAGAVCIASGLFLGAQGTFAPRHGDDRAIAVIMLIISIEALVLVLLWFAKPIRDDSDDSTRV